MTQEEYNGLKNKYSDSIILESCGKVVRFYLDDAIEVCKMVGRKPELVVEFPLHKEDLLIRQLLRDGKKVAIYSNK